MRSGLLAKGLRKALDEILKDIAAVHGADFIRAEVALGGVELLDDQIQAVALHHTADDVVKIELGQHILHIAGKPGQIVPEIRFNVVRVCQQALKSKPAGVIELIAGGTGQKAVDNRQLLNLFILLDHRIVGGQQAVVKPLDHRHRQNHKAIFVGLERPAKHIRHIPDHRGLFLYIYAHGTAFFIDHWSLLQFMYTAFAILSALRLVLFFIMNACCIPKCQFDTLEPPCWHFGISPKYQFDTLEAES